MPAMVESIAKPCLGSLSQSVKDNLLVIDNSPEGFAHKYGVKYEHHPENLGVSRAWNIGAHRVVEEKLDYLIMLSAAIVFNQGMDDFLPKLTDPKGVESQFSYHLIAVGRPTFETIGYFDENFYPAYYDDSDWIQRTKLAGISFPHVDVDATRQGIALTLQSGLLTVNMGAVKDYFVKKWGHEPNYATKSPSEEMWDHPFNDPTKSLSYWETHTVEELKKEYGL